MMPGFDHLMSARLSVEGVMIAPVEAVWR
jgi:hypothetical protein